MPARILLAARTAAVWGSRSYRCVRIYTLFDAAVGNLMAMESLRHGTCFSNYFWINVTGADPNAGATRPGETTWFEASGQKGYRSDCERHFFVAKDTDFKDGCCHKRLMPASYCWVSSCSAWRDDRLSCHTQWPLYGLGIALGLGHPTLKFRYDPQEIPQIFENDPSMGKTAYRTHHALPNHRIGITGSLRHGINGRLTRRIQERPDLLMLGFMQLLIAIGLSLQIAGIGPTMPLSNSSKRAIRWSIKTIRFLALQPIHFSAW